MSFGSEGWSDNGLSAKAGRAHRGTCLLFGGPDPDPGTPPVDEELSFAQEAVEHEGEVAVRRLQIYAVVDAQEREGGVRDQPSRRTRWRT